MKNLRVLVVDDSALIRKLLTEIISAGDGLEVVGTAPDPFVARERIKSLKPDVITLDVEMPRMDGLTFLANLMRLRPMPVVMISTLTEKGAEVTLRALELGAVDFVSKPKLDVSQGLAEYSEEIHSKIRAAARARISLAVDRGERSVTLDGTSGQAVVTHSAQSTAGRQDFRTTEQIIGLGASTGGTEAIKDVLATLPATTPAIVISQHLPLAFSESFARHVDQVCSMNVCLAEDNQTILPGHVYIAPGDRHLCVVRNGARYTCRLDDGESVNRHRPSVDVMFNSLAENVGVNASAILLTGMGADGARGMKAMHDAGSSTIIQDEQSSVVWGMPGEAFRLGCADHVLPLHAIAGRLITLLQ